MEVATSTAMVADEWTLKQKKTLIRWVNSKLIAATATEMPKVTSAEAIELFENLCDGLILIKLTNQLVYEANQVAPSSELYYLAPMNNRPKFKLQRIENLNDYINYLVKILRMADLTISAENIYNGDVKPVVGMLWKLFMFSCRKRSWMGVKLSMLQWINQVMEPAGLQISNFTKDWSIETGHPDQYLEAIYNRFVEVPPLPDLVSAKIEKLLDFGEEELEIPKILDITDFKAKSIDEQCILPYLLELYNAFNPVLEGDLDEVKKTKKSGKEAKNTEAKKVENAKMEEKKDVNEDKIEVKKEDVKEDVKEDKKEDKKDDKKYGIKEVKKEDHEQPKQVKEIEATVKEVPVAEEMGTAEDMEALEDDDENEEEGEEDDDEEEDDGDEDDDDEDDEDDEDEVDEEELTEDELSSTASDTTEVASEEAPTAKCDFSTVNDLVYVIMATLKLKMRYERNAQQFLDKTAATQRELVPEFADFTSELISALNGLESSTDLISSFNSLLKLSVMPQMTQMNTLVELYKQFIKKGRAHFLLIHQELGKLEGTINQNLATIDPHLTYFPVNLAYAYANLFCSIMDLYTAAYQLGYFFKQVVEKLHNCPFEKVIQTLEQSGSTCDKPVLVDCLQQFGLVVKLRDGFNQMYKIFALDELEPMVPEFVIPTVAAPVFSIDGNLYPAFKEKLLKGKTTLLTKKGKTKLDFATLTKFLGNFNMDTKHVDDLVRMMPYVGEEDTNDADFRLEPLLALASSLLDGEGDSLFENIHVSWKDRVFDMARFIERLELGFSI